MVGIGGIMDKTSTGSSEYLSGFVAIVGPPNVGKSTLLNRLLGKKVAIVSPKPQTTRNRILGIFHGKGFQIAFLDTPGIHRTRTTLHRSMVSSAQDTILEVDIIMLVIEMSRPDDPEIPLIMRNIKSIEKPLILAINKIDIGPKEEVLPIIDTYVKQYSIDEIIPISALKGNGVERLLDELKRKIRAGPQFFPEDMTTDQSEEFLVSEIIREKIYLYTRREIPYSSAVKVKRMEEIPEKGLLSIYAVIYVESESQKAIIIGDKGRKIKKIGQTARLDLEKMFSSHIYLDLFVRVEKNWSRDTKALRRLGY
jgi:GTP-binding protein Era